MLRRVSRFSCLGLLLSAGCVRQDTEILAPVGRKLADKARVSTADLRDKFPFRVSTVGAESSLADAIQQRFASDKLLAGTAIDVQVSGNDVELKGTLEKDEQKLRALNLVETTRGVEKVTDSLQLNPAP